MTKITSAVAFVILFSINSIAQKANDKINVGPTFQEVSFLSLDSLEITADLYRIEKEDAPYIILFHQANYSRGAYRSIAPKLNKMGYNCLAVDQRSGHKAEDVINKTCKRAIKSNRRIRFIDAVQDMEASLLYVKNELKSDNIIIWGSSYSASVVFYLGSKYPNDVNGILSFSPGEYLKIDEQPISHYSSKVECPVFVASGKKERKKWNGIYENVNSRKSFYLPESGGAHGSKALLEDNKGHEGYWEAVMAFLGNMD